MLRMRQLLWHSLPFNKSMQANIIMRVPPARIHPLGLTGKDTVSFRKFYVMISNFCLYSSCSEPSGSAVYSPD
nr:unnamed protein product [Callosobruchus chinensis]CAH7735285.1 unnamed protein product [Callosobruchus chinensis]CAH7766600.1 unnamed protein product [Callosobruchus chinensis]